MSFYTPTALPTRRTARPAAAHPTRSAHHRDGDDRHGAPPAGPEGAEHPPRPGPMAEPLARAS